MAGSAGNAHLQGGHEGARRGERGGRSGGCRAGSEARGVVARGHGGRRGDQVGGAGPPGAPRGGHGPPEGGRPVHLVDQLHWWPPTTCMFQRSS